MNNEEMEKITNQLKEILNKYPNKQQEILLYVFGRDNLIKLINEPTYEQLQTENKKLKERIDNLIYFLESLFVNKEIEVNGHKYIVGEGEILLKEICLEILKGDNNE